jgi:uncharacterized protein YfeS
LTSLGAGARIAAVINLRRGKGLGPTRNSVDTLDDDWELSVETAHPNAAKLLQEPFYWDTGDENSPFGNDSAAAVLQFYRAAVETDPGLDSGDFLAELFEEWDIDRDFAEGIPDEALGHRLEFEHFHILTYDDVVVAVAFAEIVFLGNASTDIAEAAIKALHRQSLPELLDFRGWSDPAERRRRCHQMAIALRKSV